MRRRLRQAYPRVLPPAPDSAQICLPMQDVNVLFGQTYLGAVRFEVRHAGYA